MIIRWVGDIKRGYMYRYSMRMIRCSYYVYRQQTVSQTKERESVNKNTLAKDLICILWTLLHIPDSMCPALRL